jgi:hypothetical protein
MNHAMDRAVLNGLVLKAEETQVEALLDDEVTPTASPTPHSTSTSTRTPRAPTYSLTHTPPSGYPPPVSESIHLDLSSGYASINLEWMLDGSLSGDLYHYDLYRNADGGNFSLIESTMHSQYADEAPTLTEGVEYCYEVKAINSASQVIGTSNMECTTIGHLTLWVPDEAAPPDATDVPVMINLANGNGLCIAAMDITIDYDESIVATTGVVSRTIYTQDYAFIANTTSAGQVKIVSITGSDQCVELYGAGTLFNVFFDVLGQEGQVSPLDFIKGFTGTVIYDQDDLFTPVDLALQNGSLTVAYDYIRGDFNGDGALNGADAALALLIASGTHTPTAKQRAACDVNGDGACNSADSTLILCYAAFQDWEQCGGSQSTTRLSERAQPGGMVDLAIGESVREGQTIRYPVEITNAPELAAGEFVFAYDAIQMMASRVSLTSLTEGFQVESNLSPPGMLHVSIASLQPIGGDGTMLELEFTSMMGGSSSLDFGAVRLYDVSGRDFYTSALQRDIRLHPVEGNPQYLLYLPAITR